MDKEAREIVELFQKSAHLKKEVIEDLIESTKNIINSIEILEERLLHVERIIGIKK